MDVRLTALVLALVASTGCSASERLDVARDGVPTIAPRPRPVQVVGHGAYAGVLAVRIANPNAEWGIHAARAYVVATAADGRVAGTTPAELPEGAACCTVIELAPKAETALYLDLGPNAATVTSVTVTVPESAWTVWDGAHPVAHTAGAALIQRPRSATVTLRAGVRGSGVRHIAVQALIVDRAGRLASVVSGVVYCFRAGADRAVRLEYYHPLPAGARVGTVFAAPFDPARFPDLGLPTCAG